VKLLAAGLALIAAQSFALEPQAPPSPPSATVKVGAVKKLPDPNRPSDEAYFYVGHFGETIEIPYGWNAEGELSAGTEIVRFRRKSQDEFGFKPIALNASDFKPENFAPMGLMELVVISKKAPGAPRSLKALRRARQEELTRNGVRFRVREETNEYAWPRGSFHLSTLDPYHLVQTYGESPGEFFILTGGYLADGEYGLSADRKLGFQQASIDAEDALSRHLMAVHKQTPGEFLFYFEETASRDLFEYFKVYLRTKDSLADREFIEYIAAYKTGDQKRMDRLNAGEFKDERPLSLTIIAALGGLLALLSFWPGTAAWVRRLRLSSRSLIIYTVLAGLAGFLIIYIPARIANAVWTYDELAILLSVLPIPWISWAAARRLGSAHSKRVLVSTGVLAVVWAVLTAWGPPSKNTDPASMTVFDVTMLLAFVGAIFAAAFALAFGPVPDANASHRGT
jgi:hypothetical protein